MYPGTITPSPKSDTETPVATGRLLRAEISRMRPCSTSRRGCSTASVGVNSLPAVKASIKRFQWRQKDDYDQDCSSLRAPTGLARRDREPEKLSLQCEFERTTTKEVASFRDTANASKSASAECYTV